MQRECSATRYKGLVATKRRHADAREYKISRAQRHDEEEQDATSAAGEAEEEHDSDECKGSKAKVAVSVCAPPLSRRDSGLLRGSLSTPGERHRRLGQASSSDETCGFTHKPRTSPRNRSGKAKMSSTPSQPAIDGKTIALALCAAVMPAHVVAWASQRMRRGVCELGVFGLPLHTAFHSAHRQKEMRFDAGSSISTLASTASKLSSIAALSRWKR